MQIKRAIKRTGLVVLLILLAGFFIPEPVTMPVQGASEKDWHADTFWYAPWGTSGVHKGVDIFAPKGTPLRASTHGMVLYRGELAKGGKVLLMLGPKWRLHYYAHLEALSGEAGRWLTSGELIGSVGDTGNAAGKPAHLHYSIVTLFPYPWRITREQQGWKKALFLDPGEYLQATQ